MLQKCPSSISCQVCAPRYYAVPFRTAAHILLNEISAVAIKNSVVMVQKTKSLAVF